MAISSKALLDVFSLEGEERRNLAEALLDENITTVQAFADKITEMTRDEGRKRVELNVLQADAIKGLPAAVWAAHVLDEHDDLIYNLALIRDAAKETAATNGSNSNVEGHYTMLLEAIDGIVEKFLDTTAGSRYQDVMRLVADKTERPAED